MELGTWGEWAGALGTVLVSGVALLQTRRLRIAAEAEARAARGRQFVLAAVPLSPGANLRRVTIENAGGTAFRDVVVTKGYWDSENSRAAHAKLSLGVLSPHTRLDLGKWSKEELEAGHGPQSASASDLTGQVWEVPLNGEAEPVRDVKPRRTSERWRRGSMRSVS